jgi:hypothetical protein
MQKKKIRSNNSGFEIHNDPSQPIITGRATLLFGIQDSSDSDAPVFLPVVFLTDIQH